jgi:cell division protein FtsQ
MKRLITSKLGHRLFQAFNDVLTIVLLLSAFIWSHHRQGERICKKVEVNISNDAENHFLEEKDVAQAIASERNNLISLRRSDSISLQNIERRVNSLTYVRSAQTWNDLAGTLHIDIELHKPIARLLHPSGDMYLCPQGNILPLSSRFTARVITVSGAGVEHLLQPKEEYKEQSQKIIQLLADINAKPEWKAMVAHVDINKNFHLQLYPVVGNEIIDFGTADNHVSKLSKLELYYNTIIPSKGWDAYSKVIVKFNGQIICEKKS